MSTTWTRDELTVRLEKAHRKAEKWLSLSPIYRVVPPHYTPFDDCFTFDLNPALVGFEIHARDNCPKWLGKLVDGVVQRAGDESESKYREDECKWLALNFAAWLIVRREGYNGYVQIRLSL